MNEEPIVLNDWDAKLKTLNVKQLDMLLDLANITKKGLRLKEDKKKRCLEHISSCKTREELAYFFDVIDKICSERGNKTNVSKTSNRQSIAGPSSTNVNIANNTNFLASAISNLNLNEDENCTKNQLNIDNLFEFDDLLFYTRVLELSYSVHRLNQAREFRNEFVLNLSNINQAIFEKNPHCNVHFRMIIVTENNEITRKIPKEIQLLVNFHPFGCETWSETFCIRDESIVIPGNFLKTHMSNQINLTVSNLNVKVKAIITGFYLYSMKKPFEDMPLNECMQVILNKSTISIEETKRRIRNKFNKRESIGADFQVLSSSIKVSLKCPIMNSRMNYPVRGYRCEHLDCFDAENYLRINESTPKWTCPLCKKSASFDSLLLDLFIKEILTKSECDEIDFDSDGKWSVPAKNTLCKTNSKTTLKNIGRLPSCICVE